MPHGNRSQGFDCPFGPPLSTPPTSPRAHLKHTLRSPITVPGGESASAQQAERCQVVGSSLICHRIRSCLYLVSSRNTAAYIGCLGFSIGSFVSVESIASNDTNKSAVIIRRVLPVRIVMAPSFHGMLKHVSQSNHGKTVYLQSKTLRKEDIYLFTLAIATMFRAHCPSERRPPQNNHAEDQKSPSAFPGPSALIALFR